MASEKLFEFFKPSIESTADHSWYITCLLSWLKLRTDLRPIWIGSHY
jgi:hypothetical protein